MGRSSRNVYHPNFNVGHHEINDHHQNKTSPAGGFTKCVPRPHSTGMQPEGFPEGPGNGPGG